MVKDLAERLDTVSAWKTDAIEQVLRAYCDEKEDWKVRDLFMTVRVLVTGRTASPPLFETMEAMGKALVQDRFRRATETLKA
jgi:glutamyl-tRNA synthetase